MIMKPPFKAYSLGGLLLTLCASMSSATTTVTVSPISAPLAFNPTTPNAPLTLSTAALDNSALNQSSPLPDSQHAGLSFNFQDVSVKTLLQIIAKNSGANFVISDSIKGNMSLSLQNVSWQKALEVVLRANGLDYRQYDNVLIIAPLEELATNDIKRLTAKQQVANLSPPTASIIHLRYANANDLAAVIKGQDSTLLSVTGQIGVDPRTNVIWIRDNAENVIKVKEFIQQLDIPARQILIEARIVSIDTKYAKELGIRWGISNAQNLSGTLEGANAIAGGTPMASVPVAQRLNFNQPTSGVFGANPASLGLAMVNLGGVNLDLELSALEGEQHGEVIANPRIVTSNLQKATIETGEEIPYQESTSSGATSVTFKKAVLSLEITPQITSNNNVVLKLKITQDKRGADVLTGSGTVPSIDTQEINSYVQLKDLETIVIGGVYKQVSSSTVTRIPFLSSLPLIGNLFKYQRIDSERNELLIFITPTLVSSSTISGLSKNEKTKNQLSLAINQGVKAEKVYESDKF